MDGCSGASGAGGASAGAEGSVVLVEAAVASAVSGFSAGISSMDRLLQERGHDDPLAHPLYEFHRENFSPR